MAIIVIAIAIFIVIHVVAIVAYSIIIRLIIIAIIITKFTIVSIYSTGHSNMLLDILRLASSFQAQIL
jgi:uncharacterized membrane protein